MAFVNCDSRDERKLNGEAFRLEGRLSKMFDLNDFAKHSLLANGGAGAEGRLWIGAITVRWS